MNIKPLLNSNSDSDIAHLAATGASPADIDRILDALASLGTPVTPAFSCRPMLSDPADEMVLETEVNGIADMIVTFNLRHLGRAAGRFGIRAARPPYALQLLEV
ncbi:MAG: PIN domain-containing protein [Candidatus Binataceae bacterium]